MDLGLRGKVAAVAAASRGLGRASSRALAREGASVALCGRDESRIREAADEIARETGASTLPVVADVAEADDCRRFVEAGDEKRSGQSGHLRGPLRSLRRDRILGNVVEERLAASGGFIPPRATRGGARMRAGGCFR